MGADTNNRFLSFGTTRDLMGRQTKWNLASNKTNEVSSSFRSTVPADPRRENYKGNIPNGTKPQSKGKPTQGNSIRTGDLLPCEKPPMVFTLGDSDEEEYKRRN